MEAPNSTATGIFTAVGELCMVWASLDGALNMTIEQVLNCTDDQAKCIATAIDPVAGRIKLLRNLLYSLGKEAAWLELTNKLLNEIEGNLCAERNRIVHDAWDFSTPEPMQLDRRAKIKKAQAHQPPALVTEVRKGVTATSINNLTERVSIAAVGLLIIRTELFLETEGKPIASKSSLLNSLDLVAKLPRQPSPQGGPESGPSSPA